MYFVLSSKLGTRVSTFQFSFFQVKTANHYEVHVIFQDTKHQLLKNIFDHLLHHSFLLNLH